MTRLLFTNCPQNAIALPASSTLIRGAVEDTGPEIKTGALQPLPVTYWLAAAMPSGRRQTASTLPAGSIAMSPTPATNGNSTGSLHAMSLVEKLRVAGAAITSPDSP